MVCSRNTLFVLILTHVKPCKLTHLVVFRRNDLDMKILHTLCLFTHLDEYNNTPSCAPTTRDLCVAVTHLGLS